MREVVNSVHHGNKKAEFCSGFAILNKPSDGLEPSTPSLPWRFSGDTRVHARSPATQFLLQIGSLEREEMRRETSRVSFLMCPVCVREVLTTSTTLSDPWRADSIRSVPRA
jgi:hypothetical protein